MCSHHSSVQCPRIWCDNKLRTLSSWCTPLYACLQHMLNKAKAEPTTDISVIFSSGALDRLAAVLQVCAPPSDILAVQLPSDLHIR